MPVTVEAMSATDDYCELCDLPKSQCIHGRPPAPEPVKASPAPRTRRTTSASRTSSVSAPTATSRSVQRRWTPPEDLVPHIVGILEDAGEPLESDEMLTALEVRIADGLRPGDRETTPEGELRWHYAARRARQALIKEGILLKAGPGVYALAR